MGAVVVISLFAAAVVAVQFGALWALVALVGVVLVAAALLIFTDLLSE